MRFIYSKTFTKIFIVFVLIALLIISDATGYIGWAKDGFFRGFSFVTSKLKAATTSVKVTFSTLFTIRKLVSENAKLSAEVDQLAFENARLKSAQNENAALRNALNFSEQGPFNLLPVEALTLDTTGFSQVVIVDKGKNHNIEIGQPVVVQPGILVGKVTNVSERSAEVLLITDPGIVVNSEVVDSTAKGLIKGEHGLGLSLDLVTQNELIKTGDAVITSGLSEEFPRGLLIGRISSIRSSSTDLFQKAFVTPAADLRNIKFLFIIQ
ncbi:MAG: rod shape-determining protein MreC [Candidatus Doudnabacteria bacterium RIFCSPLOWO2_02_FULL_42_9]|uniref:Cell shape-determining protein MreC n=1 Tax=Candidatus Doudnabacteria bacterium RIFCSPHIGHO2_01_FULL_41_86 TaxID=1817821 RepID=A0A1F5N982_9BACT|nr:MAG: rod shape-determining protein MreC [Candidatus Doudnabacteria bacterium RIFCSPHIGHO2_01_FULL_41_86]OGE74882.1 MAG: rod shape-determining protein MreC [Candidatus Doudnabacteria bacterium RIFCSPHIGHO2_01_43_10]OGE85227.1 MAG: rod shape-determining protein MreC [Candidatus Doudnabacteria bacterium RIFCSPHIGHO2_12_FULL_42_22]OGE86765.1 MAG: rod shape-determining protein MreC [Candidatus Doudnabacteria bacterium RIFCSPHIGHO2_02_FULL_42_25]OGE92363.1 MAG: rod shape-determining protein MreC [